MWYCNVSFITRTLFKIISNSLSRLPTCVCILHCCMLRYSFPFSNKFLKSMVAFDFSLRCVTRKEGDMRLLWYICAQHICARKRPDVLDDLNGMWAYTRYIIIYMLCRLMHCPKDDTTQRVELCLTQVKLPMCFMLVLFYSRNVTFPTHTNELSKDHFQLSVSLLNAVKF